MKAIILAAGEGMRMRPLTLKTPKPLLPINGRPVLDYVFDALPDEITEVVVVVKYLGNQIKKFLGNEYHGRQVCYAEGSNKGTAYSFLTAKDFIKNDKRFLVMHGDEFPFIEDVRQCLSYPLSIIVSEYAQPEKAGVVSMDIDGFIEKIVEKPSMPESNIIVGGIMVLNNEVFYYEPLSDKKKEFYLTSVLNQFVKKNPVKAVFARKFIGDITVPEDIKKIESILQRT